MYNIKSWHMESVEARTVYQQSLGFTFAEWLLPRLLAFDAHTLRKSVMTPGMQATPEVLNLLCPVGMACASAPDVLARSSGCRSVMPQVR